MRNLFHHIFEDVRPFFVRYGEDVVLVFVTLSLHLADFLTPG